MATFKVSVKVEGQQPYSESYVSQALSACKKLANYINAAEAIKEGKQPEDIDPRDTYGFKKMAEVVLFELENAKKYVLSTQDPNMQR